MTAAGMLLLYDEGVLRHETPARHPEQPERVRRAWARLENSGLAARCRTAAATPLRAGDLSAAHVPELAAAAARLCAAGGGYLDADTPVAKGSLDAALLAAGMAVQAVDAVLDGTARNAFALIRPPGHHATRGQSMGFCIANNVALAAARALSRGVERVLIVDWDVHHGNGTQDIFYDDARVAFLSAHRYPFYPGTGLASETGTGAGLGATFNVPLPYGTTPLQYHDAFNAALDAAARKCRPELVLLSAGFDAHRQDPVGDLGLDMEDFDRLGRAVLAVAGEYAGGKVVSLLEGGYNVGVLAGCVEEHVRLMLAASAANGA